MAPKKANESSSSDSEASSKGGAGAMECHLQPIDEDPVDHHDDIYVESVKTGKYYKLKRDPHGAPKLGRRRRARRQLKSEEGDALAALDAELDAVDAGLREAPEVEDRSVYLERALAVFFTAGRGVLSGYSAATATIAYALSEGEELVDHYGRVSNLFRRWAFLIATVAFVGALNTYQVAHQDRSVWKRMDPVLQLELRFLVVLYGCALALTLAMATVEVSLSNSFNDDDFTWQDKFNAHGLTSLGT